jgi:hypothetical protein
LPGFRCVRAVGSGFRAPRKKVRASWLFPLVVACLGLLVGDASAIGNESPLRVGSGTRAPLKAHVAAVAQPRCAPAPRPVTGYLLVRSPDRGAGKLSIENRLSEDAVIQLVANRETVLAVYVRAGGKFTVWRIPDGRYGVYWTTGSARSGTIRAAGWDPKLLRVMCPTDSRRHESKLEFTTERTSSGTRFSAWELVLYETAGRRSGRRVTPPPLRG